MCLFGWNKQNIKNDELYVLYSTQFMDDDGIVAVIGRINGFMSENQVNGRCLWKMELMFGRNNQLHNTSKNLGVSYM